MLPCNATAAAAAKKRLPHAAPHRSWPLPVLACVKAGNEPRHRLSSSPSPAASVHQLRLLLPQRSWRRCPATLTTPGKRECACVCVYWSVRLCIGVCVCVFGFCNYFLIKDVLGKPKNTKPTAERSCHTEAAEAVAAAEAEAAFNQHKRITWQRSLSCIAAGDMGQEAPTAERGRKGDGAENEKCLSKK